VRDILSWVDLMCSATSHARTHTHTTHTHMSGSAAFVHGACLTVLDGLGIGTGMSHTLIHSLKQRVGG